MSKIVPFSGRTNLSARPKSPLTREEYLQGVSALAHFLTDAELRSFARALREVTRERTRHLEQHGGAR